MSTSLVGSRGITGRHSAAYQPRPRALHQAKRRQPQPAGRQAIPYQMDEALPGFGVRINPTNKVWVVSNVTGRVPVGGVAEVVIGGCRLGLGCEIHS